MKTSQLRRFVGLLACTLALNAVTSSAHAESQYEKLAGLPFTEGYIPKGDAPTLTDELFFQRAVQTYLWAM